MLEGTDLMSAYQPLNQSFSAANAYDFASVEEQQPERTREQEIVQRPKASNQVVQQQPQVQKSIAIPQQQMNDPHMTGVMYDASLFNKQYEQEQRIMHALNELKKRKEDVVTVSSQPSYVDKLMAKKKELGRILQFALIIMLGLSLHYIVDHYLKNYISEHDLSPERQLFLRLLYPFAVLFLLWNLKVFVK